MNCPECSGPVEPTQRFCNWCGVALNPAPTSTAPTSTTPTSSDDASASPRSSADDEQAPETATSIADTAPRIVAPTTGPAETVPLEVLPVDVVPSGPAETVVEVDPPADQPPTELLPAPAVASGSDDVEATVELIVGADGEETQTMPLTDIGQPDGVIVQPRPPLDDLPPAAAVDKATIDSEPSTTDAPTDSHDDAGANEVTDSNDSDSDDDADNVDAADDVDTADDVDAAVGGDGVDGDVTVDLTRPEDSGPLPPVPIGSSGDDADGTDSMWSPGHVVAPVVATSATARLEAPLETPHATPYDLAAGAVDSATTVIDETNARETTVVTPTVGSGANSTMVMPATRGHSSDDRRRHFRVTPLLVTGVIGGIVAVAAMFVKMVVIASDVPLDVASDNAFGFSVGEWRAGDLAGNLPIAGIIVALGMILGAVAAGFGYRWGAGLAGGSGAAAVGVALLSLGLAQFPIDAAQLIAEVPSEQRFILSITRDVGYWLQVAAAAIGLVVLWASLPDARADHRRSLNPWIAALGALATLVAAIGPMLPVNQGLFSDNWYLVDAVGEPSQLLIIARLVQIAAFALTGIIGFLIVSRYGLGLVFGGTLAAAWLTVSTVLNLTPNPVGFAFRNPGETTMQVHGVTIIGIAATLAVALIACAAVLEQNARRR